MKAWWYRLSGRDRRVLVMGVVALVVILYIFVLRLPAQRAVQDYEVQVSRERERVVWMQHARAEIAALRSARPEAAAEVTEIDEALFSFAEASAHSAGFERFLQRVEPAGDNGVRLHFDAVAFNDLVGWLARLRREYGVHAVQLAVDRGSDTGRVEARMILEKR